MAKSVGEKWVLRSMLFAPGHIEKMVRKAAVSEADCVVMDLEDAVPEKNKADARVQIRQALEEGLYANKLVMARINPLETGLTLLDLDAVACKQLQGFVYPMAYTADDIKAFDAQLSLIESHLGLDKGHFKVIVLMETPEAILNSLAIAKSSDRLVGLLFGCEDYLAELEGRHSPDFDLSLHAPRSIMAMAARAAGIEPIDTPYVKVHDTDGMRDFANRGRDLGMSGCLVMTPRQIPIAHEVYTPSEEDVKFASEVVKAAEEARAEGRGIVVVDGKFVSPPTLKGAEKVLACHQAIQSMLESRNG